MNRRHESMSRTLKKHETRHDETAGLKHLLHSAAHRRTYKPSVGKETRCIRLWRYEGDGVGKGTVEEFLGDGAAIGIN